MELKGIDIHVHLKDEEAIKASGARAAQMAAYFGRENKPVPIDEMADMFRSRGIMAVLQNSSDITVTGNIPVPNDHIADVVRQHPDVFIGFGIVDPWQGKVAIEEVKRCAQELGLKGIGELNPGRQHFYANDERFYPLWEECVKQGMVVLLHSGMMGAGAGTPGGMGGKLKYTRPIPYFDDLAADFPELNIISAHPSWPYTAESLAIARHKSNFYIDLSGWAPKYFSQELVQYATTILQNKCLFGSDWPAIPLDRWLNEFAELPMSDEVRQKIMVGNAKKLLKLE